MRNVHNRNIPCVYIWLYWCMFTISYASECQHHVALCSADLGSFWYSRWRPQVNHEGWKVYFFLISSGIWYDMKLASNNKLTCKCNLMDPSSLQTPIQEWLNSGTDLVSYKTCPLVMFFRVSHFHWDPSGTKMVCVNLWIQWRNNNWAPNICQTQFRPGGNTERNKIWTLILRNSHSLE